jgi:hypothetical protein
VAEDDGQLGRVDLGVAQVQVSAADGAGPDAEEELARAGHRVGERAFDHRLAGSVEDDRLHLCELSWIG